MEERYQEREEAQQLADMQELQSQLPDVELPEDAETEEPLFPDQQAMTNELPAQEDSEISEPIQVVNFHITDDALGRGTAKEKFRWKPIEFSFVSFLLFYNSSGRNARNITPGATWGTVRQQIYLQRFLEILKAFYAGFCKKTHNQAIFSPPYYSKSWKSGI